MPNLYGDILSDVAAQIAGSVGLAGSANIGPGSAMFEAIHGSAPRRAGQNLANPSGLLLASVMMLVHLGLNEAAENVHNAWLKTIEEGIHTYDIFKEGISAKKVGTKEFALAVAANLGKKPEQLKVVSYAQAPPAVTTSRSAKKSTSVPAKQICGVDIYLDSLRGVEEIKNAMELIAGELQLTLIGNRGAKLWPNTMAETF